MHPTRIIFHLTANHLKQLKRKWRSLSLLLPFPLLFISLLSFLAIQIMTPERVTPIEIGLVGLDHAKESRMIVNMLQTNKDFKESLHIEELAAEEAEQQIAADQLSAYITFPDAFSSKLYRGESIVLDVTGNPNKRLDAEIVHTFIKSATKHINSAQANILTIGEYAENAGLAKNDRRTLLENEFKKYIFFTLAKDQALDEELVSYNAAANTILYYVLSGIFASWLIWLLLFWQFFQTDDNPGIARRIHLYGVRTIDVIIARLAAVLVTAVPLAAAILLVLPFGSDSVLDLTDYGLALITLLLGGCSFLLSLSLIESILRSRKIRIIIHTIWFIILLVMSGAIIPLSFFPHKVSSTSNYLFATTGFQNLQSITMSDNEPYSVNFILITPLLLFCILYILSRWKERLN